MVFALRPGTVLKMGMVGPLFANGNSVDRTSVIKFKRCEGRFLQIDHKEICTALIVGSAVLTWSIIRC